MNDYDREVAEGIRDDLCNYLDDYEIGDGMRDLIHKLYDIVDDFITDADLEADE